MTRIRLVLNRECSRRSLTCACLRPPPHLHESWARQVLHAASLPISWSAVVYGVPHSFAVACLSHSGSIIVYQSTCDRDFPITVLLLSGIALASSIKTYSPCRGFTAMQAQAPLCCCYCRALYVRESYAGLAEDPSLLLTQGRCLHGTCCTIFIHIMHPPRTLSARLHGC